MPQADFVRYFYPLQTLRADCDYNADAPSSFDACLGRTRHITLREEGAGVVGGTTGLKTWEASLRLGSHLVREQSAYLWRGTRVLELGSGAGLLAVLCAQMLSGHGGASSVLATDLGGSVMERLHYTQRLSAYVQRAVP